ncbi:MAG: DUF5602 domain-containing protein, partial [bacterium]|nr:DUF5602 domain-containing protein [Candidatus Kapabacteria bacterium]
MLQIKRGTAAIMNNIRPMRIVMLRYRTLLFSIISALAIVVAGCEDNPTTTPTERTAFGASSSISGGAVRSFVTLDKDGNPKAMGLRISETTVNGMHSNGGGGHSHDDMHDIALPAEAAKTPVEHISLDWNPEGHEPAGIYDTAHFDMHFYTVAKSARMTWDMQGEDAARLTKVPAATLVPPGYVMGPPVPFMGLHFVDPTSGEFGGQKFNSTFIWGYYNGQQAFMEPMITQWYLKSKTEHTQTLKLPASYTKSGLYYPTTYTIRFDASTKEHVITL